MKDDERRMQKREKDREVDEAEFADGKKRLAAERKLKEKKANALGLKLKQQKDERDRLERERLEREWQAQEEARLKAEQEQMLHAEWGDKLKSLFAEFEDDPNFQALPVMKKAKPPLKSSTPAPPRSPTPPLVRTRSKSPEWRPRTTSAAKSRAQKHN